MNYEDTIMGEQGACIQCGVLVDEGNNYGEGDWLCEDCAPEDDQ